VVDARHVLYQLDRPRRAAGDAGLAAGAPGGDAALPRGGHDRQTRRHGRVDVERRLAEAVDGREATVRPHLARPRPRGEARGFS
jgi:hypothetical protein